MAFAIGFLVSRGLELKSDEADSVESEEVRYRIGRHDCRNCKYNIIIDEDGWVKCKVGRRTLRDLPKHCAQYRKI